MSRLTTAFYFLSLAYLFASPIATSLLTPHFSEIRLYPLWKYDLFAFSPRYIEGFQIRLLKLDDTSYVEGIDLFEAIPTIDGQTFSPSKMISVMGKSLLHGDYSTFDVNQRLFHNLVFYKYKYVEYSIHTAHWRPIERYRYGRIEKEEELGKFSFSRP